MTGEEIRENFKTFYENLVKTTGNASEEISIFAKNLINFCGYRIL